MWWGWFGWGGRLENGGIKLWPSIVELEMINTILIIEQYFDYRYMPNYPAIWHLVEKNTWKLFWIDSQSLQLLLRLILSNFFEYQSCITLFSLSKCINLYFTVSYTLYTISWVFAIMTSFTSDYVFLFVYN